MKNIVKTIVVTLLLTACGRPPIENVRKIDPPAPSPAPVASSAPSPSPNASPVPARLEGYYTLPNGGYLDLYEDAQGLFTIRAARLTVTNANGSTGVLPIASMSATAATSGVLYYNSNQTYVALTHGVKQDSNNADLVGSFLTELKIYKTREGTLKISVMILNSTTVLFNHAIVE